MYRLISGTTDLTQSNNIKALHLAASTAAVVLLRDGSASGNIVARVQVPASPGPSKEATWPAPGGLRFPLGFMSTWRAGQASLGAWTYELAAR